jgi:CheY-like chemotaxis protein
LVHGLTILVVDDDEFVRDSIRMLLEDAGARVLTAPDGANALDQLTVHTPDLILSDLVMPGMDGYQFVERVRSDPARARVPVVAVSAFFNPADQRRTVQVGFDTQLRKPFGYAGLRKALTVVMRRHRELFARQLGRLRALAKRGREKAWKLRQGSRS